MAERTPPTGCILVTAHEVQEWIDQVMRQADGEYSQHALGYREALRRLQVRLDRKIKTATPPEPRKRKYTKRKEAVE